MIEVRIEKKDQHLIAKIEIENLADSDDPELGNYTIRIGVDNAQGDSAVYQRHIEAFPRTKYNVLALLLQALNTLTPEELQLADSTDTSDLARRQRRTLPALQLRGLHHH